PRLRRSGIQPLFAPLAVLEDVDDALMPAEGLLLPELDAVGHDAVAGPEGRPRHRGDRVLERVRGAGLLEVVVALHRMGLLRGPRPELAEARPRREVG